MRTDVKICDAYFVRREDIPTIMIDSELAMMNIEKGKYFSLNEIGTIIWNKLDKEKTITELVVELLQEFDVDQVTCRNDVKNYVNKLVDQGLIKIVKSN